MLNEYGTLKFNLSVQKHKAFFTKPMDSRIVSPTPQHSYSLQNKMLLVFSGKRYILARTSYFILNRHNSVGSRVQTRQIRFTQGRARAHTGTPERTDLALSSV